MHKQHRLRRASDIEPVRRSDQRCHHALAVLLVRKTDEQVSRFGFSASRRVGNAVKRNRAKRLLREATRRHLLEIKPGWDCLFIARDKTAVASFWEVEKAVVALFGQAGLFITGDSE